MKFTLTALAILASAAMAAPAADAEAWCERPGQSCWKAKREATPEAWCERPGQSCWKVKRDASAEAWCERPGQSCWKVKRAAEAFVDSISTSGGLEARSPEADLSNLPGGAAFKAKRGVDELAHIVSLTKNSPDAFYNDLNLESHFERDSDAKEKRDALPAPWCERPGQSCWKRDASADAEAIAQDTDWCERPGQSCFKAKRAAEAVLDSINSHEARDLDKKSFDPEFAKRNAEAYAEADAEAWCERPGQSCWKARRDLNAIEVAARSILETAE